MASVAFLVIGLPGSGKTTVSATLAGVLGCPLLAVDPVQEALADLAGPMIAPQAVRRIAVEAVWAMAGEVEAGVVVDAGWQRDRDLDGVRAGVGQAGSPRVLEVWCDAAPELALARSVARVEGGGRHPVHGTAAELADGWADRAAAAGPLDAWPVVRVDTSGGEVDVDALVMEISAYFV